MIKKILIVDDSPIARKILKSCIPKDKGFELFEAGDGLAGVLKYQQLHPDVTFLDLTMPIMDGIEALAKIKSMDSRALVIVSTADIQKKTVEKVQELGAFRMLKKPPNKETVERTLAEVQEYLDQLLVP